MRACVGWCVYRGENGVIPQVEMRVDIGVVEGEGEDEGEGEGLRRVWAWGQVCGHACTVKGRVIDWKAWTEKVDQT